MSILGTKVLLAVDGSREASLAARAALDLSSRTGSELHVIYVGEVPLIYHPEHHGYHARLEDLRAEARQRLDEQLERIAAAGGNVAQVHLKMGRPDEEIVSVAEETDAGVVVMGSRGLSGLRRALMGSVSDSVMRHAHCPVMVVRDEAGGEEAFTGEHGIFPTRILVATDGSQSSSIAVNEAVDLAQATGSGLHVVHVLPVSRLYSSADIVLAGGIPVYEESRRKAERVLEEDVRKAEEAGASRPKAHLLEGQPDAEVVALAEDIGAGVIVVGSRGLDALRRALMGSTSTSIVRHAHCPVLVVREEKGGIADE